MDRKRASRRLFGGTAATPSAPQTFDVACPSCAQSIRGQRVEGYQAIRCTTCGQGVFVLPASPFEEPPVPTRRSKSPRRGGRAVEEAIPEIAWTDPIPVAPPISHDLPDAESLEIVWSDVEPDPEPVPPPKSRKPAPRPAPSPIVEQVPEEEPLIELPRRRRSRLPLILLALIALVAATVAYRVIQSRKQDYPRLVAEGYQRGIPALEQGQFDVAKRLLSAAARAAEGLSMQVEHADEVVRAAAEAELFADLVKVSLEELIDEAGRSSSDEDWAERFRVFYAGQAIIIEATVGSTDGPRGVDLDYRILVGPGPVPDRRGRLDLRGFRLVEEELRPGQGKTVLFGARLESVTLDPQDNLWLVRLVPESGRVLTYLKALESIGWSRVKESADAGAPGAAVRGDPSAPLANLTPNQVRDRLGKPDRVQRVAVQGLLIEQWSYQAATSTQLVNFRVRPGKTPPVAVGGYALP